MQRKILPYSMIFFLTLSLVIGIWGARANAQITLAFEEQFCMGPDGILWKHFTRLGKGTASHLSPEQRHSLSPCTVHLVQLHLGHLEAVQNLQGSTLSLATKRSRWFIFRIVMLWHPDILRFARLHFFLRHKTCPD